MLLFTAVNCVFAYVALMLFLPLVHLQHESNWRSAILHPLYLLGGAGLLGIAGALCCWDSPTGSASARIASSSCSIALVVLVVGCARALNLPVVVALLTLGMLARNLDDDHALLPLRFRLRRPAAVRGAVRAHGRGPGFQRPGKPRRA